MRHQTIPRTRQQSQSLIQSILHESFKEKQIIKTQTVKKPTQNTNLRHRPITFLL